MHMILLSSTVLILLLLGLRPFLKKWISPGVVYALWLLVALRLLLPFQLGQSFLSLENLTKKEPVSTVPLPSSPKEQFHPLGEPVTDAPFIPNSSLSEITPSRPLEDVSPSLPLTDYEEEASPSPISPLSTEPMKQNAQAHSPVVQSSSPSTEPQRLSWTSAQILQLIWLVGFLGMVVWFSCVNFLFYRRAKKGAKLLDLPQSPLAVYESDTLPSPCLLGVFKAKIFLLPQTNSQQQKHILAHEHTHYRHGDSLWALVRCFCLCLYWFHPLVWVAAYLSKEDCELACDQGAIRTLGEAERIPYGKTLLQTLTQANCPNSLLRTATTMGDGKKQLRNRLEQIVKKPQKALWALPVLLLVVSLAVGCTFTTSTPPATDKNLLASTETEAPATTHPTEEDPTNATEESTPSIGNLVLAYGDTQVVDVAVTEEQIVPQFTLDTPDGNRINEEIQAIYGTDTNYCPYKELSWESYETGPKDSPLLTLKIRGITSEGTENCFYFSLRLDTGEALAPSDPQVNCQIVAQELAYELMQSYIATGELTFTQEDYDRFLGNLSVAQQEHPIQVKRNGDQIVSFPYEVLNGKGIVMVESPIPGGHAPLIQGIPEPKVLDLYSYTDANGKVNTIPFLLANDPVAFAYNTEILLHYLAAAVEDVTYSVAVNKDILSFSLRAKAPHTEDYQCLAANFSTVHPTGYVLTKEEVLSHANPPMTLEEYQEKAHTLFSSYFFDLFPTEEEIVYPFMADIIEQSGAMQNIHASIPYLDENGKVWALAHIYKVAGSSFSSHLIPITEGKVNPNYLSYRENSDRTLVSTAPPDASAYEVVSCSHTDSYSISQWHKNLGNTPLPLYGLPTYTEKEIQQKAEAQITNYLHHLYGEKEYELSRQAKEALPTYADENIYIVSRKDSLDIRPAKNLSLQGLSRIDQLTHIPELQAAIALLGFTHPQVLQEGHYDEQNKVIYYRHLITETYDADTEEINKHLKYIEIITEPYSQDVHILVYEKEAQKPVISSDLERGFAPTLSFNRFMESHKLQTVRDSLTIELFYNDTLVPGYFIPCYRIYVPLFRSYAFGNPGYQVYEVTESDFLELTPLP